MAIELSAAELTRVRLCSDRDCTQEVGPSEQFCSAHRRGGPQSPARPLADPLGLDVHSLTVDFAGWTEMLARVAILEQATSWWLGDLLADERWDDSRKYAVAAERTGLSVKHLYHLCWVSRAVRRDRRVRGLSWSAHRCVARLSAAQQVEWLQRAIDEHLTVAELAAALGDDADVDDVPVAATRVRRRREILRAPADDVLLRLEIHAPADQVELWRRRASDRGLSLAVIAAELLTRELGRPFSDNLTTA
jgi:hypothetical protein